ncbi:hypothetical protein CXF46_05255 [Corynebacterium bovis]|nr:hypothetical protein CXF46_05255 [Corynebacterium bovis]
MAGSAPLAGAHANPAPAPVPAAGAPAAADPAGAPAPADPASAPAGNPAPATPATPPLGTSLMHRDMNSSDSVPWSGPGQGQAVKWSVPGGSCSTVFQGTDGMPIGLCTRYLGRNLTPITPSVTLFDPDTAQPLTTLELEKHGLLGGVYGYLDEQGRVVLAEGHDILRIGHHKDADGWKLTVDERTPLGDIGTDASLAGLVPDGAGRTWFATEDAVVGSVEGSGPDATVRTRRVGTEPDEKIANGLTPRPNGVSVLTTHRLYEVGADADGTPAVRWQRDYDRGSARKPGQLSWGSGSTPTFFGPDDSRVAIVDNADGRPNLMVMDAATGEDVCTMPAFETSGQGTENSVIAHGDSLWVPSTYGFAYPPMAVDGPASPASAPFTGGLTKIDLVRDASGEHCVRQWEKPEARLSTLPMMTTEDNRIWSFTTDPGRSEVSLLGLDAATGEEVVRRPVGRLPFDEPMELTGMIAPNGDMWQATATRMVKIEK